MEVYFLMTDAPYKVQCDGMDDHTKYNVFDSMI